MTYLKLFNDTSSAISDQTLVTPNITYVADSNTLLMSRHGAIRPISIKKDNQDKLWVDDTTKDYLTFTCVSTGHIVLYNNDNTPNIEYSKNGSEWIAFDSDVTMEVNDVIKFRGNNPNGFSTDLYNFSRFDIYGLYTASGNVMSLIDGQKIGTREIPCDYCFVNLFNDCDALLNAPALPALTLKANCYQYMFQNCYNMTIGPVLPAIHVESNSYRCMFDECSALTKIETVDQTTLDAIISGDNENHVSVNEKFPVYYYAYYKGESYKGEFCLAAGTKIKMANGSVKNIEDITENDQIMSFNHENGELTGTNITILYKSEKVGTALKLIFEDGNTLSIVGKHSLLEKESKKYIKIWGDNINDYVGKYFYNTVKKEWIKLIDYKVEDKVNYYSIYAAHQLNCIANDMLNTPDDLCYGLNLYEFDDNLIIDQEQYQKDIEKYGLCLLKDHPEYEPIRKQFEELHFYNVYIAIGKGYLTRAEVEEYKKYWLRK